LTRWQFWFGLMTGCGPVAWGEPEPIVAVEGWRKWAGTDPFGVQPDDAYCDSTSWGPADFGGEPTFDVQTQFCSWLTVQQATTTAVLRDDRVFLRLWHDTLTAWDEGVGANLGLWVDGEIVWTTYIPIPADGAIVLADLELRRELPAGTLVAFHIDNHGANSYHLLEVSRRPAVGRGDAVDVSP
jgi:hypothetical protein